LNAQIETLDNLVKELQATVESKTNTVNELTIVNQDYEELYGSLQEAMKNEASDAWEQSQIEVE